MNCTHETIDCPNHAGAYDCTPFCRVCEGNQGYCPECDPINYQTCNCECGCDVPLSWGTCIDCGEGDHQNNNEIELG